MTLKRFPVTTHGKKYYSKRRTSLRPGDVVMGIAWLWYQTGSANPDHLNASNERRAFLIHSRWRSMLGWLGALRDRYQRYREARAGSQELLDMSDHILRDVGLLRIGGRLKLEGAYQPIRPDQPARLDGSMPGEVKLSCRRVPAETLAVPHTADRPMPDKPVRAA